jgi:predicted DNA-binding WGR domain protein
MRRFEYTDDKSAKFWEIEQAGTDLNIRWGRIGTAGQSQTKNFADAAKAGTAMARLVTEKTGKGYTEPATAPGAAIGAAPVKAASATPVPATPAPQQADAARAPAESVDQQIERAFEGVRAQIASPTLLFADGLVTSARIRRAHGVGELAADQVLKLLESAGLVAPWSSILTDRAKDIAIAIGEARAAAGPQVPDMQAPAGPADAPAVQPAPWLAEGEPVRLGGPADATRTLALPTRRHPQPLAAPDMQRSWQQARSSIGIGLAPDFVGSDPALREVFAAAWNSLDDPAPGGTPQTDAVLVALCFDRTGRDHNGAGWHLVDYLVARHGLLHAIEAQLEAMLLSVEEEQIWQKDHPVRMQYRAGSASRPYHGLPMSNGQWRLRAHLAVAPQDVYDACAARVRQAIGTLDLDRRVTLALLFPDLPALTHEVIAHIGESDAEFASTAHWLQLTATDPAALAQAGKIRPDTYDNFWDQSDMVATILLEHRSDAVRWLAPGAAQECAGDALTRIGTPDAIDALARVAGGAKPALARFSLAVDRWPVAAAAALARLLGGSAKDQGLLMAALVDLVRKDPALPARLQPWLEPAANAVLEAVRARLAGPADVAAAGDLPEVLAQVPWLQPKKKSAAPLQLAPLPLAPVERWDAGEKDAVLALSIWQKNYYQDAGRLPDLMAQKLGFAHDMSNPAYAASFEAARAAIAQGEPGGLLAAWHSMLLERKKERYRYYALDGIAVAHLPAALGIRFWNGAAGEASCSGVEYVAATWGLPALPGVLARIAAAPGENLGIALHFGAVELGPAAARAFIKLKSLRAVGREWLKRFPEHAACALIAPALGKPNEARDCAAAALRYLAGIGHLALIERVAARHGQPEVLPALHAMLNENPLDRYPNRRPALPGFWKPDGWRRPLLHNGRALSNASLDVLGTMLMFPATDEVYAGLLQVKAACTAESLADFAWDCFASWLNAAAPSKEVWAMLALGVFGSDDTARKLTPYIRSWPGESAHARAVTALDVLAAIGSDVALMLLNGIAQKVKFKGLQDKARDKILAIAEARGLSPEELEDRLAPDLGLDEQGSLLLDFGPRAYKVGFDESLKPYVREWQDGRAGARLPDLPKPKKTDDDTLAAQAAERFKLLKKDARTIASQQVLRLELAMCARRRWSPDVFARFIAGHPLLRHLVRRLVWGVYAMPLEAGAEADHGEERRVAGYGGTLLDCFRVAEDGAYTSAADDPFALPEGAQIRIGLPHALELPASQATDFGQLLADYELLQPFPQLGRDTYALDEQERATARLLRWKGVKVPTGKVLGLANAGWRRGPAQDGGCIWTYDKAADAGRRLELKLEPGIIVGLVDEYPEQTLDEITLGRGIRGGWDTYAELASFGTLDPIVASELIRDMERLRS